MKELNVGTENIGSLIKRFSIPCVISMVVAALYNIVDQIFIGWSEVGAYGNAATNIVYPFTVLALGLALLVGWCFFDRSLVKAISERIYF